MYVLYEKYTENSLMKNRSKVKDGKKIQALTHKSSYLY